LKRFLRWQHSGLLNFLNLNKLGQDRLRSELKKGNRISDRDKSFSSLKSIKMGDKTFSNRLLKMGEMIQGIYFSNLIHNRQRN